MSRLKLDENLSRHLKSTLSSLRHDVVTAEDDGLLSQPDAVVARAAAEEGRALLTLDAGFADLRKYPPGTHPGIVLFRPRSFGPGTVHAMIEEFIRSTDLVEFAGCTVLVEPGRIRIRRPSPDLEPPSDA